MARPRLMILVIVAIVMTIAVYGTVGVIVKMDDVGLRLAQGDSAPVRRFGRALVSAMPKVMATLSIVGVVAMLWVGGHILLTGTDTLGWHPIYAFVHHLQESVAHATGAAGPALGFLTNTAASAVIGLVVESQCSYHAPLAYPDGLRAGLRVDKLGNRSVTYGIAIFGRDVESPSAEGYFVHVFVDRDSRRAVPIPDRIREALTWIQA